MSEDNTGGGHVRRPALHMQSQHCRQGARKWPRFVTSTGKEVYGCMPARARGRRRAPRLGAGTPRRSGCPPQRLCLPAAPGQTAAACCRECPARLSAMGLCMLCKCELALLAECCPRSANRTSTESSCSSSHEALHTASSVSNTDKRCSVLCYLRGRMQSGHGVFVLSLYAAFHGGLMLSKHS